MRAPVVISVGGSLIVPDEIDTDFLSTFKTLITEEVAKGHRFVIICGGGKTARRYQEAAKAVVPIAAEDLDWLGIHSTRLNAHLLRTLLTDISHPRVVKNPYEVGYFEEDVLVCAGWRPGRSTDYCAVVAAKNCNAQKLINLTNTNGVYTADPKKDKKATMIKDIDWPSFRKLIPEHWDPGLSSPFDPVASREAEKLNIEVAVMNGKKLEALAHYLDGAEFIGTRIH